MLCGTARHGMEHMPNVEHLFVLYALLLEPGGCLRAHITLFELVEPEGKKKRMLCGTHIAGLTLGSVQGVRPPAARTG